MSYTVPYSFVPGTKARAQEVNANFAAINDSFELIDENKVNLDLSNITSAGLDVIKNNSSVRNIGELIFSPIPLTDSNLHLLDGSLIPGNGIYHDFVNYIKNIYNTNSRYNSDVFAVTGNPIISNDGVASDFSLSNYLTISPNIDLSDFCITWVFDLNALPNTGDNLTIAQFTGSGSEYRNRLTYYRDSLSIGFSLLLQDGTSTSTALVVPVSGLGKYEANLSFNGSKYIFTLIAPDNSAQTTEFNSNSQLDVTSTNLYLGRGIASQGYFSNGSIDLKELLIKKGQVTIFSGKNICNYFTDENTWQSTVSAYGECGKFVYNSSANSVRLPKINGLIEFSTNITETGNITEAGLPNITGWQNSVRRDGDTNSSGALRSYWTRTGVSSGTGGGQAANIEFNASWSDEIYGKSNTVQPQTVKYLIYIVVSSTPKTNIQIDIDNIVSDLNGKLNADFTNIQGSNIKNFDGQWVYSNTEILSNVTASGATGYQYDLGSYLPHDGNKYEVIFSLWGQTGSSSGNGFYVWAGTDIIGPGTSSDNGKIQVARTRTVSSMSQYGGGSFTLPVGTGRKLYLYFTNSDSTSGIYLKALCYRRIGTNS